ncbi:thioredoxin family protein [Flavobacterium sp. I3-2]|uniref:thioredoxin family protein n=1 Tax=Flavobacterium sp. I3-2 TaxID=2748319 RepID=UPI0015AD7794|nr:thioredoxin family protein [Flavobacterium sp. I3-2]
MKTIITKSLQQTMDYLQYRELVTESLKLESQVVNGIDLIPYTKLNDQRMKRLDKTIVISDENSAFLKSFENKILWLVLTEGWCGDAAQALPVLNKMAELSDAIELKIVLRDENEDLMNQFLTNGGKSIPKVIMMHPETLEVIADWGPRPAGAVQLMVDLKEKFGSITDEVKEELQKWYNNDKTISTQNEIVQILKNSVL